MFDFLDIKVFKDVVHGYINVPSVFVKHIIDTKLFQRLRNIEQTGMRILYPSARHDRFSHSLGVFHLGQKAVNALLENFSIDKNALHWNIRSDSGRELFWAKNKVLFLIACLLHDIGHAPFSHSLENYLLLRSRGEEVRTAVVDYIRQEKDPDESRSLHSAISASPHELIGARMIFDHFTEPVKNILCDLNKVSFPSHGSNSLYAEYVNPVPSIDDSEIKDDIAFISRMILGLKYKRYTPEKQIRNCFIELLNGGNFDVDKLDYIMRDTIMSGITNIGIDVERLIAAISIVTQTQYLDVLLGDGKINIGENPFIYEMKLKGDMHIKGEIFGTLRLEGPTEVTISKGSTFESLSPYKDAAKEMALIFSTATEFEPSTKIVIDGTVHKSSSDSNKENSLPVNVLRPSLHVLLVENAKITDKIEFKFKVEQGSTYYLKFKGECEIKINGEAFSEGPIRVRNGLCEGSLTALTLVGDTLVDCVPTERGCNIFSVGFKKQAINIIANVLDARDYLYKWIYAHHKVIYYANFLLPVVANFVLPEEMGSQFPAFPLKYENIDKLDDAYIIAAARAAAEDSSLPPKGLALINEFFQHRYKKSLYKSLAEYDIFFYPFSPQEKNSIRALLASNTLDTCYVEDLSRKKTAGFFTEDWLNKINVLAQKYIEEQRITENIGNVTSLVWVDASYQQKKLNNHQTYIIFPQETSVLGNLDLFDVQMEVLNKKTAHYFYLYYSADSESEKTSEILKATLTIFFKDILTSAI